MQRDLIITDGNEAVAGVAYQANEFIAIYPITPASPMGEWADRWAAEGRTNLWGNVPRVVEMQSEAGAAGALHGAIQAGALGTTFTASQGLLLMIPNMYKIAGELTPTVIHVAARSIAAQALSIFGDHSDVMAARSTGFAMLASNSVQEAMDFALIAQAATLESRIPFLHFFDGFRTSHEIDTVHNVSREPIREMIDDRLVAAHRARALTPDHPFIRGTAQNPDVYFQARESVNPFYRACPAIVEQVMDRFARLTGRRYRLFDYAGAPDADRVLVIMGSGAETVEQTVHRLNVSNYKVGVLKVRLYRPFSVEHFIASLPRTVRRIAVLDRTKEPGSAGEPLYVDVVTAMAEAFSGGLPPFPEAPRIVGGRYGLASKEFTPAMAKAIFDQIAAAEPVNHFTIGIRDDVTNSSLDYDPAFSIESPETMRAIFYGLGSDGTISANKNSIKIIGEEAGFYGQAYFVYDSKKAGTMTVSHLRFGPEPVRAPYLIRDAGFVACHQFSFVERLNILEQAAPGATFLLNAPYPAAEVWGRLPRTIQEEIIRKHLRVFAIDAYQVAREAGLGRRINTIMQTCFFQISGILPAERALAAIRSAIEKTYQKHGSALVGRNLAAVAQALHHLHEIPIPAGATSTLDLRPPVPAHAPIFVRNVIGEMIAGRGDNLPVSALPPDGAYPSGTTQWEKRNLTQEVPVWDEQLCIQCGKCVLICPHAAIRSKLFARDGLGAAPPSLKSAPARWRQSKDSSYVLQVSPLDCTGCTLCVEICPAKRKTDPAHRALNMGPLEPIKEAECGNWEFFSGEPDTNRSQLNPAQVKDVQLLEPLFEFSGACSGCGETPYLKLLTQLFGDRTIVANATGCSSIFGGNLPTTPWAVGKCGRGPAWSNSLFEDNAEFGLGIRMALDQQRAHARRILESLSDSAGKELSEALLNADQASEAGLQAQRARVADLRERLRTVEGPDAQRLTELADALVEKTVWIVGGDGWAYDIGFGGLDHVLASGANVKILVLDTEVYSNTGGQMSKATPRGAVARFAAGGKTTPKKDLAAMAMTYGSVYVARVAIGANDSQTVKAFLEAEAYPGPALIIAYSPCIEHGYDLSRGLIQQHAAVKTGYWPLFRYNPARDGKDLLVFDSKPNALALEDYIYKEGRFSSLLDSDPETARRLLDLARKDVADRWHLYEAVARSSVKAGE